jgi:hypothetical protein
MKTKSALAAIANWFAAVTAAAQVAPPPSAPGTAAVKKSAEHVTLNPVARHDILGRLFHDEWEERAA